jgi:hemolysin activation/secretion protein
MPLDIVIVEGFVETIELAGPDLPLSLSSAFPGLLGQPLYLPDLEQGLDQLNRLRAYELGATLLPGELQGGTRVVVQPARLLHAGTWTAASTTVAAS